MKKKLLTTVMLIAMTFSAGCLLDTYPLTDEEQDIIAEYAAGVLLRNDENYAEALLSPTPLPSPTPSLSPTPEPTKAAEDDNGSQGGSSHGGSGATADKIQTSLTQVYGLEGLQVSYDGFEVAESFEENSMAYVVKAADGKKLVKVKLTLSNTAGIEQQIQFGALEIGYQLDCDEPAFVQPKITLFTEDLLFLDAKIPAGSQTSGFVIFEIDRKSDAENANFIVSRDSYAAIIPLK